MNELGWKLIYWFCVIVIIFLLSLIGYLAYSATRDTIEPYEPDPAYNRSNLTDKWRNIYLKNILPTANHTLALGEYGYKLSNQIRAIAS